MKEFLFLDVRLSKLEESMAPKRHVLNCVVFGDQDAAAAAEQLRATRNWPDDGAHPVRVLRLRWVTSEDLKVL